MRMPKATAVILTALDNEFEEVMHHVDRIDSITHPAGTVYTVGTFDGGNTTWAIVVAPNGKRNVRTAILTERAIRFFEPDVLIFVGCAGGRKEIDFGDVVAAARVSDAEAGADTRQGFEGADQGNTIQYELEEKLRNLGDGWKARAMILPKFNAINKTKFNAIKKKGKLRVATIASGEKTQKAKNSRTAEYIGRASRDAVAIDTESQGFLTAAQMNNHRCAFIVRGISDKLADKSASKDEFKQPVATALASAVAFEFLAKHTPHISLTSSTAIDAPGTAMILELLSHKFEVPKAPKRGRKKIKDNFTMDFGPYADAGFFAEVIAEKASGREPDEVDIEILCEIATVCQKAGYIETSWRFLLEALGRADNPPLSIAVKAHAYWVALRLLSQSGNMYGVIKNFENVVAWLELNNEKGKIAPIYSRAGVAYAVLNNHVESKRCFERAVKHAQMGNEHQRVTVNVLWAIANYFRSVPFEADPIQTVIEAQLHYLINKVDAHLAQAYPLKSTVQCLFAEGAMLLSGKGMDKGLLRIAAASVMRRRAFSHPDAEGFAELLALIPSLHTRAILRNSMDPSVATFPAPEIRPFLSKCSSITHLFSFGDPEWKKMRAFLDSDGITLETTGS